MNLKKFERYPLTFGKLMGSIFSSAITTGGLTVLILSAIMGEKVED